MVEPFEGGEFFVNGDSVGAASKGWKQISVKPGEHAIKFVAAEGDFQKTFEKKVKIIDKQIEEVIFDTNNEEFTFSYLGETKDGRERFLKKYPVFKKDRYFTLHGDDSRISTVYYMFKSNGDYCEKVNSFGVLYFSCSNGKDTVVLNEKGEVIVRDAVRQVREKVIKDFKKEGVLEISCQFDKILLRTDNERRSRF